MEYQGMIDFNAYQPARHQKKSEFNAKDLFDQFIDKLQYGEMFHPRDVVRYIEIATNGARSPHDGTITRYIRGRRQERHDVELVNRVTSRYCKC